MKIELNDQNFNAEVLESDIPVLVDFWAEWCGPCKMIEPVINEIAEETAGKLKVASVNIDSCPDLAGRYGIMSIPTLAIFKGGEVAEKIIGAMPKSNIMEKVQPFIG